MLFNDVFPGSDREYVTLRNFYKMFNNQGGSGNCTDVVVKLDPVGAATPGGKRR